MDERLPTRKDETEYVGAPAEYADAAEVPQWVATAAEVLFFLPSALVTATTLPIIGGVLLLMLCLACLVLRALV